MANQTDPPNPATTIVLKCSSLGQTNYVEGVLGVAATPGMLMERYTALTVPDGEYKPHATAAIAAEKIVLMEQGWIADIPYITFTGGGIDDVAAIGDRVRMHICKPGDELYMWLPASAAAVLLTDTLTSNGDGTLKKGATTDIRLFKPLEAKDNSGNSASKLRIRVRAL